MEAMINGFQLFQQGGPVMYLLLACSLFAVYIGIERAMFFTQMDAGNAFANRFYTYMKVHKTEAARSLAADSSGGLPLMLTEVLTVREGLNGKPLSKCSRGSSCPVFEVTSII